MNFFIKKKKKKKFNQPRQTDTIGIFVKTLNTWCLLNVLLLFALFVQLKNQKLLHLIISILSCYSDINFHWFCLLQQYRE